MSTSDKFRINDLCIAPVSREASNQRWVHKVTYKDHDNLVIETPPLSIGSLDLIVEKGQTQKIMVRCALTKDNKAFRRVMLAIDKRIYQEASFKEYKQFAPSYDYYGTFTFFVPIYDNHINLLVTQNNGETSSLSSIRKQTTCRLLLLLSHVESHDNVFFPIWNVIQMKIVDN